MELNCKSADQELSQPYASSQQEKSNQTQVGVSGLPAKENNKHNPPNFSIIDVAQDLVPKPFKQSPISQPGGIKDIKGALDTPLERLVSQFNPATSTHQFGGEARDVTANSFSRGSENRWDDDSGISADLEDDWEGSIRLSDSYSDEEESKEPKN